MNERNEKLCDTDNSTLQIHNVIKQGNIIDLINVKNINSNPSNKLIKKKVTFKSELQIVEVESYKNTLRIIFSQQQLYENNTCNLI
jgi:hypothetical protein